MEKLIRVSAQEEPKAYTFEQLLERYNVHLLNEARKLKGGYLNNDVLTNKDDIYQELLIRFYEAYMGYDITRGAFTTHWVWVMKSYRSGKVAKNTRQKRGGFTDEEGNAMSVIHTGIETITESGETIVIADPSLMEESQESLSSLMVVLKNYKTESRVGDALIDNLTTENEFNVADVAIELGVSRQYVNIVKNKLKLKLQKELEEF